MFSIYVKPSSHVLAIQEMGAAVNMQRTVFTIARLKIVPTLKNLIIDVVFMIVRCDAVRSIYSLEIHNWYKWLDGDMGK